MEIVHTTKLESDAWATKNDEYVDNTIVDLTDVKMKGHTKLEYLVLEHLRRC